MSGEDGAVFATVDAMSQTLTVAELIALLVKMGIAKPQPDRRKKERES